MALVAPCFHTPLRVEKILGTNRNWRVLEPLVFESKALQGFLVLPGESIIDFASVPRILWAVLPPTGQYDYATAMHDGAYRALLTTLAGYPVHLIRELADQLMVECCEATAVGDDEKWLLYHGVRLGGAGSYHGLGSAGLLPNQECVLPAIR